MKKETGVTYGELVILTRWLADRGHAASYVADAVEKPWHYAAELSLAKAVRDHEAAFTTGPVHQCQPAYDDNPTGGAEGRWICAVEWWQGVEQVCSWEWTPKGEDEQ